MKTFREMAELEMSDLQHKVAKGNKQHVLVHMHPLHFLDLTTDSKMPPSHFRSAAQKVDDYNSYTRSGETLNSPFLTIHKDGKVLGHEGRHRAAALLNDGETRMPVHIRIQDHEDLASVSYRDIGWEHVPDRLHNQYDRPVSIPKKEMSLVKDRVASLKESDGSMAHEVMMAHGMNKGIGGHDWYAPEGAHIDRTAMHKDIVGAGFEHEHSYSSGHIYKIDFYKSPAGTLTINHKDPGYAQAAFTTNGIPYRQRYPKEKYEDFKE